MVLQPAMAQRDKFGRHRNFGAGFDYLKFG
jgi:hypothetical protein